MLRVLLFVVLAVYLAATECAAYSVLPPPNPSRTVRHAGDELAKYLRQMTGERVTISQNAADPAFILGGPEANPAAKALLESGKLTEPKEWASETNPEAYYLQSAKGGSVVLAGKSDRAILYAVYDYLQRYGKCGFFEDGDYVPRKSPPVSGVSYFTKPRLSIRDFQGDVCGNFGLKKFHCGHRTVDDWVKFYDWLAKRRMNMSGVTAGVDALWAGNAVEMTFGVKVDATPGEQYSGAWPSGWTWPAKERARILQRRVAYMHDLGIKTLWSFMFGLCPTKFRKLHPEMKWVPSNYGHSLLYPDDPLATELSTKFYKTVIGLYGTDHYYADNPYSESQSATTVEESIRLKTAAALKACEILKAVDPEATWINETWDFHALPNVWTPENKKKFLEALPHDMTFYFDAAADLAPLYASCGYFYGLPWALGNLHTYQGDDHLHGSLAGVIGIMQQAVNDPKSDKLTGYFHLPEIHGANIMYWQLSTELAWDPRNVNLKDYLDDFTLTRYGEESYPTMRKAVDAVVEGVYSGQNYQPIYHKIGNADKSWWPIVEESQQFGPPQLPALANTVRALGRAVSAALSQQEKQKDNPLYENDMVDWTKSYLAHMFNYSIIRAHLAFREGDTASMRKWSKYADDLLIRVEQILSTRPDFSLQKTIDDIMSVPGANPSTAAMVREQCITFLYATNDVYEQIRHYYRPKVELYLSELEKRAARGEKKIAWSDIAGECEKIDKRWLAGPIEVPAAERYRGTTLDAIREAFRFAVRIQNDLSDNIGP